MGVLNVTPDSFSDGGLYDDPGAAEARALQMEAEGADILDVGGESSRPGSKPVSAQIEKKRILPVLKRLARRIKIPLSVDTYKPEVARAALDEGAVLVNDIFGLRKDPALAKVIARYRAGVVVMHMRGTPATMQRDTHYRDLFREIIAKLRRSVREALDAGVDASRIIVDPGFGFGKTAEQNLRILARLDRFAVLKRPVLAGLSRKSFIGQIIGSPVSERLYGSLAAGAVAIAHGAHILRVHDVLAHRQMAAVADRGFF